MEKAVVIWKVVIAILALFGTDHYANGCTCMPGHPQQKLCRDGAFAALVKVRNVEYVYTVTRPKYSDNKDKTQSGKKYTDKADDEKNFFLPEMEEVEIVVKDRKKMERKYYTASYIRYRIKIYEAYKGLKPEETVGKKMYLYTAPYDSLCGVTLDAKEMYLVIGFISEDRLHIGLCDEVTKWNSFDIKQKRSVKRNMRESNWLCATKCEIKTCIWDWDTECDDSDKNTCVWTNAHDKLNIHKANYICRPKVGDENRTCEWRNTLESTSNKKRRRKRRHHLGMKPAVALDDEKLIELGP